MTARSASSGLRTGGVPRSVVMGPSLGTGYAGAESTTPPVRAPGPSAAGRRLAAVPSLRETTADAPAPVRAISNALSQWIGQLGPVWVEGQVTQFTRRPG